MTQQRQKKKKVKAVERLEVQSIKQTSKQEEARKRTITAERWLTMLCCCRGPKFGSQHPARLLTATATPALGDQVASAGSFVLVFAQTTHIT